MTSVIVVIGPGLIGQAIARRVGVGKHVLLADMREENANADQALVGVGAARTSAYRVQRARRKVSSALPAGAGATERRTALR